MKLSRTDFVPLLTIMAGGVLGASLSFGFLGQSPSEDVPGVLLGILYDPRVGGSRGASECHGGKDRGRLDGDLAGRRVL